MLNAVGTLVCRLAGSCETSLDIRAGFTPLSPPLLIFFSSSSSLRHFSSYAQSQPQEFHPINQLLFNCSRAISYTSSGHFLDRPNNFQIFLTPSSQQKTCQTRNNILDSINCESQFVTRQQGLRDNDDNQISITEFPVITYVYPEKSLENFITVIVNIRLQHSSPSALRISIYSQVVNDN